ncbi:MAG: HI0074 family nucleotidyltransferase substrate-binding subunit [Candidatus Pacebacteria bacterium]|nr:HI0074 family nucleotidyltransferase substrate-binding subunit [Candidatus Paceibacterota bacterium]
MASDYVVTIKTLIRAIITLKKAHESYIAMSLRGLESDELLNVRDGIVQRFEYNFEIIRRYLKKTLQSYYDRTELHYRKDLFREAYRFELIINPENWMNYQELRNQTSQEYYESYAAKIFAIVPQFVIDAEETVTRIQKLEQDVDEPKS